MTVMRVGVSSRGNAWLSMGCLGWLLLSPFILTGYVLYVMVLLVIALVRAIVVLVREVRGTR